MKPYELYRRFLIPLSYEPREPVRVITVRVPKGVHDQLYEQAHDVWTTMNRFCISKLIAEIEDCPIVPEYSGDLAEFVRLRDELLFRPRLMEHEA